MSSPPEPRRWGGRWRARRALPRAVRVVALSCAAGVGVCLGDGADGGSQCALGGADCPASRALTELVQAGQPALVGNLPLGRLLSWTPESLAAAAPTLRNVWTLPAVIESMAESNRAGVVRFTYLEESRTLTPHLRAPWSPPRHGVRKSIPTEEFFRDCAGTGGERLFYSGAAEVAEGRLHSDVTALTEAFTSAVAQAYQGGRTSRSTKVDTNAWLSCGLTGTGLHYDLSENVVVQVYGQKVFDLLPPSAAASLETPPTGHPYSRQVIGANPVDSEFVSFNLTQGEALYLPPLWAHRTASGAGASISVNVFADSALPAAAEALLALPLPLEGHWPLELLHDAVALYVRTFLGALDVPLSLTRARWRRVLLANETAAAAPCGPLADTALATRVEDRARAAAAVLKGFPQQAHTLLAVDYADDVAMGMLGAVEAKAFVEACLQEEDPSPDAAAA